MQVCRSLARALSVSLLRHVNPILSGPREQLVFQHLSLVDSNRLLANVSGAPSPEMKLSLTLASVGL